jgi:hypothetical protein
MIGLQSFPISMRDFFVGVGLKETYLLVDDTLPFLLKNTCTKIITKSNLILFFKCFCSTLCCFLYFLSIKTVPAGYKRQTANILGPTNHLPLHCRRTINIPIWSLSRRINDKFVSLPLHPVFCAVFIAIFAPPRRCPRIFCRPVSHRYFAVSV